MSTVINVGTTHQPHGFTLNTLYLSIYFHGSVPLRDVPGCIPVEISVRLADEWTGFLPVVHVAPNHESTHAEILDPAVFPFLPLPSNFEPSDISHWQRLTKAIETCLVASTGLENKRPEAYHVMRDLFWMAFVASFPTFPAGDWPVWDARIPMQGGFISSWVRREDEVAGTPFVQQAIWGQFKTIVEHMLSIPVTLPSPPPRPPVVSSWMCCHALIHLGQVILSIRTSSNPPSLFPHPPNGLEP
ncbi:hypothetical protein V8E55_002590 [Tylopilus felleus]